jgi:hypothetical protein
MYLNFVILCNTFALNGIQMISFHQNKTSVLESVGRVVNVRPQSSYHIYRVSSAQRSLSRACKITPYIMGHQEMSEDKFHWTLLNTVPCCLCYEFIPFRIWWLIICWCHLSYICAYVSGLLEIIEDLFLISQQNIRFSDFCKGLNYAVDLFCIVWYTLCLWGSIVYLLDLRNVKYMYVCNRSNEVHCRVEFALEM